MAAQQRRILLTCDVADFLLLHSAWRRWFVAYTVAPVPTHAGIVVIPQPDYRRDLWLPDAAAGENNALVSRESSLINRLYLWTASRGWVEH